MTVAPRMRRVSRNMQREGIVYTEERRASHEARE